MIEIIPAIDIIEGRCVRLTQGDYGQKTVYGLSVVDAAKSFENAGLRRLHMVDLDGAKASQPMNLKVLEQVASSTGLDIEYGGGIKSRQALSDVLSAGAGRVICGSIAVSEPEMFKEWLAAFGGEHIILGADIKDGRVATHGWLKESGVGCLCAHRYVCRRGSCAGHMHRHLARRNVAGAVDRVLHRPAKSLPAARRNRQRRECRACRT